MPPGAGVEELLQDNKAEADPARAPGFEVDGANSSGTFPSTRQRALNAPAWRGTKLLVRGLLKPNPGNARARRPKKPRRQMRITLELTKWSNTMWTPTLSSGLWGEPNIRTFIVVYCLATSGWCAPGLSLPYSVKL